MPHIRATVTDPDLPADTRRALAEGLTRLAVSALGKSAERTLVHLDLVPADRYWVGGQPLADGGRDAHLEVSITAGTNSAAQKEAFITGAHAFLTDLLGPLARGGVALHELHPESYGYQGITQFEHYRRN
ncbi:tautomerase family protein [Streptomyces luteocolor]|uniref:tautomerase family protein n=1 Tax=Streptomyces luteocolor TaxID=285500 RepID=UPI000853A6BE|nr:4-oxalocrotonate tautomerase family protein [Streptomyces luteocolor]